MTQDPTLRDEQAVGCCGPLRVPPFHADQQTCPRRGLCRTFFRSLCPFSPFCGDPLVTLNMNPTPFSGLSQDPEGAPGAPRGLRLCAGIVLLLIKGFYVNILILCRTSLKNFSLQLGVSEKACPFYFVRSGSALCLLGRGMDD